MQNMLDVFGINCFDETQLKKRVSTSIFNEFKSVQKGDKELSPHIADIIATAVKNWAIDNGATHFTHWFQPLTELTAEKHESFISISADGNPLFQFSGKELIKGEADTSSFPNGGTRATFEARGYTAWDLNSPMFIRGEGLAKSLYIPTAFIGYNGVALDKKVPLLRSIDFVTDQALRLKKALGDKNVKKIENTLGIEQEYFLVEKEFWKKRQDLMLTGRTLFGTLPPKGQELNDHYYGTIKERVESFMAELDAELWKIGILAKTKHNEVAPNQFEIALMFASANVSVDQNQLAMDIIKKVAERRNLAALLHEKPFQGVNGSGKHCNWSLSTDQGENLLDPSSLSEENLGFLVFMMAILEAVDRYSKILRTSTATPGNDHRLGGHEAPPAIISAFIGYELEQIYENIGKIPLEVVDQENLELNIKNLPKIPKDVSDRNRTSPFAFTGNKFEFRMPGSSASASTPIFIMNTIIGTVFKEYSDFLLTIPKEKLKKNIVKLIKERYAKHKRIVFSGNGYEEAWIIEAEKRGLENIKNTVTALPVYLEEKTIELFSNANILSKTELESRYVVYCERYIKQINIEVGTALRMVRTEIYPVLVEYASTIANSINSISLALGNDEFISADKEKLIRLLSTKNDISNCLSLIDDKYEEFTNIEPLYDKALFLETEIVPLLEKLRYSVDKTEKYVKKSMLALPTYEDLLFKL
ncbi:MAG: glutamine synthetase III [Fusobacteriaceae bacterium]